jgi:hypothetical protein
MLADVRQQRLQNAFAVIEGDRLGLSEKVHRSSPNVKDETRPQMARSVRQHDP